MATITLQPDLAEQVTQMAEIAGIGVTDLINEAISGYLQRFSHEKIEAEAQAFERMHETLKEQYFGQFVAVYNGQMVDADAMQSAINEIGNFRAKTTFYKFLIVFCIFDNIVQDR